MKYFPDKILPVLALIMACQISVNSVEAATFTLTISPAAITFPDQDPDLFPSTQAGAQVNVQVSTSGMGGANYSLRALSAGNLTSAGSSIPISNISWTAVKTAGDNFVVFQPGNLTAAVPGATVMTGRGNDANASGTLTFFIVNSWAYATGNYSQVTNFTLASP